MIKKVFDMENPIMQGLAFVFDLMWLNLLAAVTMLPVVTAGASLVALHDVTARMIRHEDFYTTKTFIRVFKENLRKGSILGMIFLAAGVLVVLSYTAAGYTIPQLRITSAATGLIVLAVSAYAFSLQAHFDNSVTNILKNAAILTIGYFPATLGSVLFTVVFYLVTLRFQQFGMPLLMLFGISLPVYMFEHLGRHTIETLKSKEA